MLNYDKHLTLNLLDLESNIQRCKNTQSMISVCRVMLLPRNVKTFAIFNQKLYRVCIGSNCVFLRESIKRILSL